MCARAEKVLDVFAAHCHDRIILGAWGSGAFGLDPAMMAGIFHDALTGRFAGVFDEVVFASSDRSEEQRFIGSFERVFG